MGSWALLLLVLLAIRVIEALAMRYAAKEKGYDDSAHVFAATFWLGFFGCVYAIALPDKMGRAADFRLHGEKTASKGSSPELGSLFPAHSQVTGGKERVFAGKTPSGVQSAREEENTVDTATVLLDDSPDRTVSGLDGIAAAGKDKKSSDTESEMDKMVEEAKAVNARFLRVKESQKSAAEPKPLETEGRKMVICSNCGFRISDSKAMFCPKCGKPIHR